MTSESRLTNQRGVIFSVEISNNVVITCSSGWCIQEEVDANQARTDAKMDIHEEKMDA
jgi:hypothetical protein